PKNATKRWEGLMGETAVEALGHLRSCRWCFSRVFCFRWPFSFINDPFLATRARQNGFFYGTAGFGEGVSGDGTYEVRATPRDMAAASPRESAREQPAQAAHDPGGQYGHLFLGFGTWLGRRSGAGSARRRGSWRPRTL